MYGSSAFHVKSENEGKELMYSPTTKVDPSMPPLYHSGDHQQQEYPDIKPLLYYGQYDYQDKNVGGNRIAYHCDYQSTNGSVVHDEDSLGSNGQVVDPGLVVGYRSVISGGICDIPTPELTPTENKCTVVTGERNVFF